MGQDTVLGSDSVKNALLSKINADITELFSAIAALTVGSGIQVSSNDTTPGYLNGKLIAGNQVSLVEGDDGGDETLQLDYSRTVYNKTSNYSLSVADCNGARTFYNSSAVGTVIFTLPAGVNGYRARFIVVSAQTLRILSSGTDRLISIGEFTTSAGGYVESAVIGTIIDVEFFAGYWFVSFSGTLSDGTNTWGTTATSAELSSVCHGNIATAAELSSVCHGNIATAAELSQLHSQGCTAADFAKLHAVPGTAIVDTTSAQNVSGPKTFTDGLTVTGGILKIASSASWAQITGNSTEHTSTGIYSGGYNSVNDTGALIVRSKDHTSSPGHAQLWATNGTTGVLGVDVLDDGTVNLPVGLQIGGVDIFNQHVNNAYGYPAIEAGTIYNVASMVTEGTWESFGGTGSGATNVDSAFDDVVASGADWVEIYVKAQVNGGPASTMLNFHLYARRTGSSVSANDSTEILNIGLFSSSAGGAVGTACISKKIPVDASGRFDLRWSSDFTGANAITIRLDGYGKNW